MYRNPRLAEERQSLNLWWAQRQATFDATNCGMAFQLKLLPVASPTIIFWAHHRTL